MQPELKVGLVTDFRDWYDFAFYPPDDSDTNFIRLASDRNYSIPKTEQFKIISKGTFLSIIPHGKPSDIKENHPEHKKVIVYLDEYAHSGYGKCLTSIEQAIKTHPGKLCSAFLDTSTSEYKSISYRILLIGDRA
ncbi:hypothetical protein [Okeania sp. SIO2B9]|uniref:hypothetical protein n=1 Tax=Okeania sp. SIO2B9 TaxID=2607782 RepID=UPI00142A2888|nr:hypothetical protein [Okeania sp. SIO2B9]NES93510.1 hypothetical protein [Okeania sp. SIO2B9]